MLSHLDGTFINGDFKNMRQFRWRVYRLEWGIIKYTPEGGCVVRSWDSEKVWRGQGQDQNTPGPLSFSLSLIRLPILVHSALLFLSLSLKLQLLPSTGLSVEVHSFYLPFRSNIILVVSFVAPRKHIEILTYKLRVTTAQQEAHSKLTEYSVPISSVYSLQFRD